MKTQIGIILLLILVNTDELFARIDTSQIYVVSEKVGETIDSLEKSKYRLFPYYSTEKFKSAQFFQVNDSLIVLKTTMKDGSVEEREITQEEISMIRLILGHKKERLEYKKSKKSRADRKGTVKGIVFSIGVVFTTISFVVIINDLKGQLE